MSDTSLPAAGDHRFRLSAAATQVCRAVIRAQSQDELLESVVRALVEEGRFVMSFYARHNPATDELVPVARYGDSTGYLDRIHLYADERPEGRGPAGTAFRTRQPYVCNDFENDPRTVQWREQARIAGWRSSVGLAVVVGGRADGILSVYARAANYFGAEEVELLQEAVLDLAGGLDRLAGEERRRQAESALAASERRLEVALRAGAVGTFEWEFGSRLTHWAGNTDQIFGFAPGEFDGLYETFESLVHPADLPRVRAAMERARESKQTFRLDFRIVRRDGSIRWLISQGEFILDRPDGPLRLCGATLDTTERKEAEAALRESEERLRQAVRAADIGIFEQVYETGQLYWSQELRDIFRVGAGDPVSMDMAYAHIHPEDRPRILAAMERALNPGGNGEFDEEYRLLFPDGVIRWVKGKAETAFSGDAGRRPERTVGAVHDVTVQKLAVEETTKLATMVEMSRDFFGIATLQGMVVYLNQAALDMSELASLEEARGKHVFDFFSEEGKRTVAPVMYETMMRTGYWIGDAEFETFRTGTLVAVEVSAFPILDEQGKPVYLATSTRNISQRKAAEAEKAELEQRLFHVNKMESIGRLAGGVAHDFNNMLTVINGQSELVLKSLKPMDPLRNSMEEIHKAGERAAGLTRQLLALSRKQVLQPEVLDLNRIVREMAPMLERLLGENVLFSLALDPDCGAIHADLHQMEQVILNLIVNARDAMPGKGNLLVETAMATLDEPYVRAHPEAKAGKFVVLSVSDNGAGMDEKTRRQIFEPFFTTKPVGKGTGLGLSTVHAVVAQSGGYVSVYSEPGLGTTLKVYLPVLEGAQETEREPVHLDAHGSKRGAETILVVEDQEQVRLYAAQALESFGYRVLQAANAGEAIQICEREGRAIDLVLSDVVMPNMSGPQMAKQLDRMLPGLRVLFMSGYTDNVLALNGEFEERFHFIEKPFSPNALAAKVREVLADPPSARARVLVVDDEQPVRVFLRAILEEAGYEVAEGKDGGDAVKGVRAGAADLVILDLVMPGQEGIETIQALRGEHSNIGIIAISGAFGGEYLKVAKVLGADAVLRKPLSAERLLESVAAVLKQRK